LTGAAGGPLARYLHEIEERARARKGPYSRKAMISRVNVELRKRQADGGDLLLNPKTVSEWFTKGCVPQDFRLVWAFTEALLAAAGAPPADPAKRRAWREEQYARCKGTWEAARDAALAAAGRRSIG
jgi:hypothetical protein